MRSLSKKFWGKTALALPVGILALFSLVSSASAWGETQVYLSRLDSAAPGTIVVDLMVEDVSNLYGAEFRLKYDPAVLAVLDSQPNQPGVQIEPGQLLPVNQGFVVMNEANPNDGAVAFAMTLLNPAPAVNGTGSLGRVTFNVLQDSPTTIEVTKADLVSSEVELIPTETTPLQIGQSDSPWGVVIVGVIALGLMVIAGAWWALKTKLQPAAQVVNRVRVQKAAAPRPGASHKGQPLKSETPSQPPAK
jgi:hypothetical protein